MTGLKFIFQDWRTNKGNIKAQLILSFYRLCFMISTHNKLVLILGSPILVVYRIFVEWVLGCEIPFRTKIGKSLRLYHGQSLTINNKAIIGSHCTLRQSTTIGNKELTPELWSDCPVLGNNVDVGSNVVIIGPIKIGDNVKIGAGSVVTKDVESNVIVAGNPAKIIKKLNVDSPKL